MIDFLSNDEYFCMIWYHSTECWPANDEKICINLLSELSYDLQYGYITLLFHQLHVGASDFDKDVWFASQILFAFLVVNYGISNTIVLEIP